ncbi:TolC family protein [Cellulosilyticum sp. I15G10I2]|uniref:TolC family protein n=1 Tax=Cellulosilyticum sp. I15G10I2 TaxID=1892843 RepID=UPI00085BB9CF|nr:TolC family protein [Cellulosilyticum sp. I15G10I2]
MKKILIGLIVFLIGLPNLYAKAAELQVLTLENAIVRAKTYSTELAQIRRSYELNGAKLNQAVSEGSYKSWQKQYLENQYVRKQEEIQEKVIAYNIAKLFDEILLNEEKLRNMESSLKIDEANLQSAKSKFQKGIISQIALNNNILSYEMAKNNKIQLENTIHSQFTSLSEMIGKTTTHFVLQKEAIIYEPFEIIGHLDGVISSKAEQNLSVWKVVELAKIESEIDYSTLEQAGNSYVTYLQLQENVVKTQETSETTKQQFENNLKTKYTELLQLQEKYKLQEKELQLLAKQLQTKQTQYEAGYSSKNEYEKLKLTYEQAETSLLEIIVKQEYIKQVIENPYLL